MSLDPSLSLEGVVKEYAAPGPLRARRFFARLGGLQIAELLEVADDDDDDLAEDDEDDDAPPLDRSGVGRRVIDGVSFDAQPGSCIVLVGPPDAGKTVLLKLIAGLARPTEGRIVVRGRVAPALTILARSLPKGQLLGPALAYIAAIVGIPPQLVRARFAEIAAFAELPVTPRTAAAAIESRQRVGLILAAMLCVDPDLVLLETQLPRTPFGERCLERLDQLRARGTIVVAETRDLRKTVLTPDRVLRLEQGRFVADERPEVESRP